MKTDSICIADEILFLAAVEVTAEVAVDAPPDILRLPYVNDLPFFIVEIIDPGLVRKILKMFFRHIGWKH